MSACSFIIFHPSATFTTFTDQCHSIVSSVVDTLQVIPNNMADKEPWKKDEEEDEDDLDETVSTSYTIAILLLIIAELCRTERCCLIRD